MDHFYSRVQGLGAESTPACQIASGSRHSVVSFATAPAADRHVARFLRTVRDWMGIILLSSIDFRFRNIAKRPNAAKNFDISLAQLDQLQAIFSVFAVIPAVKCRVSIAALEKTVE